MNLVDKKELRIVFMGTPEFAVATLANWFKIIII